MSLGLLIIVPLMVICGAISFYRLRRGGPGPQMNWIPRSLRPAADRSYERHGWQKPFADDGSRNPERTQL